MSAPQTTINDLAGLVIFQGLAAPGVIPAPNAVAGQKLVSIRVLSATGAQAQQNAVQNAPPPAPGSDASASFSAYVIEGGNIVQISPANLSGSTFIALLTGP